MKKRMMMLLFALILTLAAAHPVLAAKEIPEDRQLPRLVDDADLLDNGEEEELLEKLDEISERQECDVVVVTVDSLEGQSPRDYADDFFDYNGYGMGNRDDGMLLLIAMDSRDWYISTHGFGVTAIKDAGREYMSEQFLPDLSGGYYYDAFCTWADLCDDFLTKAYTGEPYDRGNLPGEGFSGGHVLLSFGIGIVIAFCVTLGMKSQLKSVRPQNSAANYVREGSMQVTEHADIFLYRKLNRPAKPQNNGGSSGSRTHTSSSGRSHGGGGGKF